LELHSNVNGGSSPSWCSKMNKIKTVKEFLKESNSPFYHGTAIAKIDIGEHIKKDDRGIITAYLPEMEKFAIFFGIGKWHTFSDSENWFLEHFERIFEE